MDSDTCQQWPQGAMAGLRQPYGFELFRGSVKDGI